MLFRSAGTYNIGLSFSGNQVKLYMSGTGSAVGQLPSYNYSTLNMYFGNEYCAAVTVPMLGGLSNVTMLTNYIDPSTYTKYGQRDLFTITFNNTLAVSQIGTWTYSVPSSTFKKIVGSRMTWDSGTSDNSQVSLNKSVTVQISQDYGHTWTQLENGYPATEYTESSSVAYTDTIFKTTIATNDSSLSDLPRMDNALIVFYDDLSMVGDAGAFVLAPRQGSYIGDTYSIKNNFFNILARSKNFGIKITQVDGSNSAATIAPSVGMGEIGRAHV